MRLAACLTAAAICALPASGRAQAPRPAQPPLAVPAPRYVGYELEIAVARPAPAVWARVGKFCDIKEWLAIVKSCVISAGTDGELGAVRTVNDTTIEVLVARTPLSYTYSQPVRAGAPYNLYHGTLEARPVTATTSKLVYSLFYDTSMIGDDATRAAELAMRHKRFEDALANMKAIAERK
jgi:hypothetical protein